MWGLLLVALPTPARADSLYDLYKKANADFRAGRYEQAEQSAKTMLELVEKLQGKDRSGSASVLHLLAAIYQAQRRYGDATPLYERALTIRDRELEQTNPDVVLTVFNLAAVYQAQGRYDDAIPLYERALTVREKTLGASHKDVLATMNTLAEAYRQKGRYADAIALSERVLAISEKELGPSHRDVASILDYMASLNFAAGRDQDAGAFRARALAIRESWKAMPPTQPLQRRVALVIGNSAYRSAPALLNPRRDAEAIAGALRQVGFQSVTLKGDLAREALIEALRGFAREAERADWALVYFAGHGIEMGGVNYLIPIDATLEADRDVPLEAVALEHVLGVVEPARKLRVVLLDACRDNPFARQMRRTMASRSVGRGLARVEPAGGTVVAYAAKDGQVALDGDAGNSPFALALLKHLPTPGVEINKLFRLVRDDVLAATGHLQEPFVYGSLPSEDFFFVAR